MTSIKCIALVGATGTIGQHILAKLLSTNLFTITILTRTSPSSPFPPSTFVKVVDYTSLPSLQSALHGQEAVVSAMSFTAISSQRNLVIAASRVPTIRRFIPSEYGNDIIRPELERFPIYQPKNEIRKLCEEVAGRGGTAFSWTTVQNASFLAPDWTLDFIVDTKNRMADIKDGGDVLFTATTYEDIAQSIVGILTHLEETANRPVKISSVDTTQNEIIAIAKELGAVGEWELTHSKTDEQEVEAFRRWGEGDRGEEVIAMFINRAFIGIPGVGRFCNNDNELLGIKGIGRDGLKKIIEQAMGR